MLHNVMLHKNTFISELYSSDDYSVKAETIFKNNHGKGSVCFKMVDQHIL